MAILAILTIMTTLAILAILKILALAILKYTKVHCNAESNARQGTRNTRNTLEIPTNAMHNDD